MMKMENGAHSTTPEHRSTTLHRVPSATNQNSTIMSAIQQTAKKRKTASSQDGLPSLGDANTNENDKMGIVVTHDVIAEMKAMLDSTRLQMTTMQNKIESLGSTVDELEKKCTGLECQHAVQQDKNEALERRCTSFERRLFLALTPREQKWVYDVPEIPSSHWTRQGYDENDMVGINDFISTIKDKTTALRGGMWVHDIGLDNPGDTLFHDDILLPHWQQMADAIQMSRQPDSPLHISLSNMELVPSVTDLLMPALATKMFKGIDFNDIYFSDLCKGIEFAIQVLRNNTSLKRLHWNDILIFNQIDANDLINAVTRHPSLQRVSLNGCCGPSVNGHDLLCSLLVMDINCTTIKFERNNIQTNGSTHLSDYLKTNPPLKELYLKNNKLDDTDAQMIADALKHNTNLKCIHLGLNDITEAGSEVLGSVIFDSTSSFNATADSNHTCTIEGLGPVIYFSDFRMQLMNELDSKANRGRKLYTLLSKTNSVVGDLDSEFGDDVVLKLSPYVLSCVHRYSLDWGTNMSVFMAAPITILYELLRGWNMPVLYDGYRERQRYAKLANNFPGKHNGATNLGGWTQGKDGSWTPGRTSGLLFRRFK